MCLHRFYRCCTSVLYSHSKNLQITSKLRTQGYRYHNLQKHLENSSGHTLCFYQYIWWNIVSRHCFWRNLSPSLRRWSSLVYKRWSSLQTKEGQMRSEFRLVGLENSLTPLTLKVWPSDHREDDCSCALLFYSLVQIFPKELHPD